ncbi:hypothetical protein [Phenylobacterium sp.]|nr:hypothetical protein [Phenylobacterium sp.]
MISVVRRVVGTLFAGLRPRRRKMALPRWAVQAEPAKRPTLPV